SGEDCAMRTVALIKRIIRQMFRDKRTLALLFIAPLLILSLMYLLFNGSSEEPKVGVLRLDQPFVDILNEADLQIIQYDAVNNGSASDGPMYDPYATIVEDRLDGFIEKRNGTIVLTLQN